MSETSQEDVGVTCVLGAGGKIGSRGNAPVLIEPMEKGDSNLN